MYLPDHKASICTTPGPPVPLGRPGRVAAVVAMILLVASLAGACGGDSDIQDILVSEPTVVDLTPRSATILAETKRDVVCAVTYGPTTEYGQMATDLDMAGSGHRDHHPLLTGLQPDTVYHYKFGGVGPDGTVLSSRDYTFRTPPEDAAGSTQPGSNLALLSTGAQVVDNSSNFGGGDNDGGWGANLAFDGDPSTQWSTDGDGDDAWIEIALPVETHVTSIGFRTRTMGDSAQIFSFRVVTDSGAIIGPFELDDATGTYYFETDTMARRLRFEAVTSSGGNTGAHEIEVYGEPAP